MSLLFLKDSLWWRFDSWQENKEWCSLPSMLMNLRILIYWFVSSYKLKLKKDIYKQQLLVCTKYFKKVIINFSQEEIWIQNAVHVVVRQPHFWRGWDGIKTSSLEKGMFYWKSAVTYICNNKGFKSYIKVDILSPIKGSNWKIGYYI